MKTPSADGYVVFHLDATRPKHPVPRIRFMTEEGEWTESLEEAAILPVEITSLLTSSPSCVMPLKLARKVVADIELAKAKVTP